MNPHRKKPKEEILLGKKTFWRYLSKKSTLTVNASIPKYLEDGILREEGISDEWVYWAISFYAELFWGEMGSKYRVGNGRIWKLPFRSSMLTFYIFQNLVCKIKKNRLCNLHTLCHAEFISEIKIPHYVHCDGVAYIKEYGVYSEAITHLVAPRYNKKVVLVTSDSLEFYHKLFSLRNPSKGSLASIEEQNLRVLNSEDSSEPKSILPISIQSDWFIYQ